MEAFEIGNEIPENQRMEKGDSGEGGRRTKARIFFEEIDKNVEIHLFDNDDWMF